MATPTTRRVLRWLFGDEGTVATDAGMQVVIVATAMAVTGVMAMSPILSALTGPFAVSDARVGAIITAYTAPSVVVVPIIGLLADRVGRRQLLVFGLVLFGGAGAAIALTTDFRLVLGLRVLQGIGFATINPIGVTIIGDHFEASREATAQGLRVTGIHTASFAVPPLSGLLVIGAWQLPFLFFGLALPVAVWAWFSLPDTGPSTRSSATGEYLRELGTLLRRPSLAAIQFSFVARFALSIGFYAYVSVLMTRTLGASALETGLVVAFVGVLALASSSQIGRLVATREPLLVLLGSLVSVGLGLAVMGLYPSYLSVGVGTVFLGLGLGVSGPVQKSLVTQLAPPALRGGAVSSAVLFQSIGQAIGPVLIGLLVALTDVAMAFLLYGVVGIGVMAPTVAAARRWHRQEADDVDD